MDRTNVNSIVRFEIIKEINSEFALVKCYVMAHGKNRNKSLFAKTTVENKLSTLDYCPVVAHLFKDEEGNYRLGGHDCYVDENYKLKSMCVPYGVVKPNTYNWEIVNEYGKDVEYLTCEAVLWVGRYPELKEAVYDENVYFNQSMEVNVKQYRPLEEDLNYTEILDFEFSALCLLNKADDDTNVEPCFISASVQPLNFSADDFMTVMNEIKTKVFELEKEGEESVNNTTENIEETPVAEDMPVVENEPVVEEPTVSVSEFQLTANQKYDAISKAVHNEDNYTPSRDVWHRVHDYDDTYVYVTRNEWTSETGIVKTCGRYTYSVEDDVVSLTSAFEEMKIMWLTLDEATAIETARDNYDSVVAENETLKTYKVQIEQIERNNAESEVFNKYEQIIGETEEFAQLKSKANEYSIEELDRECKFIVADYAMKNNTEDNAEMRKFSVENEQPKQNRYGSIGEEYGYIN